MGKWTEEDKARVLNTIMGGCNGRLSARPRRQIAEMTDTTQRQLREIVRALNEQGEPVLPSNNGYYYSKDPEEIRRVAQRYHSMGANCITHATYLMDIVNKINAAPQAAIPGMS